MKKRTRIVLFSLWGLAVAGSRIGYLLFRWRSVTDTYGYFANAMILAEKERALFSSGLASAYIESLSDLLLFAGNRIEAVCIYQTVLQILWIFFFAAGISLLFGKLTGIVSATILAALPMMLDSIIDPSTENFFMLHLSLNLFVLGVFYLQAQKAVWYERRLCELYLLLAGFYAGVICIWNYVGFLLPAVAGFVLICNYVVLKKKITIQKSEKERKLKDQIMGAGYQGFLLLAGMITGMFATLMKYTGITGYTLKEQFDWWRVQLERFPLRCQDLSTWLIIALPGAVIAGIICQSIFHVVSKGHETEKEEIMVEWEKENDMEEKPGEYVTSIDGRRIRLLDNPLPTPKKHVKKELEFDFDFDDEKIRQEEKCSKMDFDVEISENDDFDFIL